MMATQMHGGDILAPRKGQDHDPTSLHSSSLLMPVSPFLRLNSDDNDHQFDTAFLDSLTADLDVSSLEGLDTLAWSGNGLGFAGPESQSTPSAAAAAAPVQRTSSLQAVPCSNFEGTATHSNVSVSQSYHPGNDAPLPAPFPSGTREHFNHADNKTWAEDRRCSMPNPTTPPLLDVEAEPQGSPPQASNSDGPHVKAKGNYEVARRSIEKSGLARRRSLRRGSSVQEQAQTHELDCKIADLSVQLERALSKNATLEGRNQLLEQFVGLQNKLSAGPAPVTHTEVWWLDAVTRQMVEQRLSLTGMLTFTLRGGRPINLTRQQVADLSWTEFCKLWKDYMEAMSAALVEAAGSAESPAGQRLARLVYETGILRGCIATASPNRHLQLQCFLADGEPRPPPPGAAHWRSIAHALALDPAQRDQLVQLRRMYLRVLGKAVRQRRHHLHNLHVALPVADGGDHSAAQYEATLEHVAQVKNSLRDEHSLLTQYKMIVWGRVFTPLQAAVCTVRAFPYAADLPAIVNEIAMECGEANAAQLLASPE